METLLSKVCKRAAAKLRLEWPALQSGQGAAKSLYDGRRLAIPQPLSRQRIPLVLNCLMEVKCYWEKPLPLNATVKVFSGMSIVGMEELGLSSPPPLLARLDHEPPDQGSKSKALEQAVVCCSCGKVPPLQPTRGKMRRATLDSLPFARTGSSQIIAAPVLHSVDAPLSPPYRKKRENTVLNRPRSHCDRNLDKPLLCVHGEKHSDKIESVLYFTTREHLNLCLFRILPS